MSFSSLRRARVLRTQQQRVLQRLARVAVRVVLDVLPGELDPLLDLAIAGGVPRSCSCSPSASDVAGIELQHFLQFLQRERVLVFLEPRPRAVEQLRNRLLPDVWSICVRRRVICGSMLPSASSSLMISPAN